MKFRILGPLQVVRNGEPLALGGKQRALLAVLLLHANETVSVDALVDALWGERAPSGAVQSMRVHISRLRKALEDSTGSEEACVLLTAPGGYELRVSEDELDVLLFERLLAEGRRDLAAQRPERAVPLLREAVRLWRGPALADLAFEPFAEVEAARLDELRTDAIEDRIEAELALGHHAEVVSQLEPLIAENPLRERLRRLQMLALYRCGRQAEALEAYRQARRTLVEEVGVEPGSGLRELHEAILRQDPAVDAPAVKQRLPVTAEAAPPRHRSARAGQGTVRPSANPHAVDRDRTGGGGDPRRGGLALGRRA
jgi:DNA-binding SARP family transcriptional activator